MQTAHLDNARADDPLLAQNKRAARNFVVLMGVVALFGDMTYEGARGLTGPYLGLLGCSATTIGFVVGLGEFTGYALRLGTGWLSDRTGAYWPLVIAGYALNLVAVPCLALVGSWQAAVALILLERVGKAVRSPARATLVSYAANTAGAGASFGIEEALDQVGAVLGPLLTAFAIWVFRDEPVSLQYRAAFGILLLPVLLNLGSVTAARARYPAPATLEPPSATEHPGLGRYFRWYVAGAMLMALGFADWALLAFHVGESGMLDAGAIPLLYAGAMAVDALAAYVFGALFDRHGLLVIAGTTALSALFAPLVFLVPSVGLLLVGVTCWAIGMGAQDSVFKAVIAALVPRSQRGRAYGVFYALFGGAWWLGSTLSGLLYQTSKTALVWFSVITQLAAVPVFIIVARRVRSGAGEPLRKQPT